MEWFFFVSKYHKTLSAPHQHNFVTFIRTEFAHNKHTFMKMLIIQLKFSSFFLLLRKMCFEFFFVFGFSFGEKYNIKYCLRAGIINLLCLQTSKAAINSYEYVIPVDLFNQVNYFTIFFILNPFLGLFKSLV